MRKHYSLKGFWDSPDYASSALGNPPALTVVKTDVSVILWSLRFQTLRRFKNQRFWEEETRDSDYADRVEHMPRLESLADHSWHIADIVLLIAPHFVSLDMGRCVQMAVLHDKLELIMGDKNPLGRDGTGNKTHAFNELKRADKDRLERAAFDDYVRKIGQDTRIVQAPIFEELFEKKSQEARFLLGIDKLQPLTYIIAKKQGKVDDDHLLFTLLYSRKAVTYFPPLFPYYKELTLRLLRGVSRNRRISLSALKARLEDGQMPLFT